MWYRLTISCNLLTWVLKAAGFFLKRMSKAQESKVPKERKQQGVNIVQHFYCNFGIQYLILHRSSTILLGIWPLERSLIYWLVVKIVPIAGAWFVLTWKPIQALDTFFNEGVGFQSSHTNKILPLYVDEYVVKISNLFTMLLTTHH